MEIQTFGGVSCNRVSVRLSGQETRFALSGGDWFGLGYWFNPCEFGQITDIEQSLPAIRAIDVGLNPGALHAVVENSRTQPSSLANHPISNEIARIHR